MKRGTLYRIVLGAALICLAVMRFNVVCARAEGPVSRRTFQREHSGS